MSKVYTRVNILLFLGIHDMSCNLRDVLYLLIIRDLSLFLENFKVIINID